MVIRAELSPESRQCGILVRGTGNGGMGSVPLQVAAYKGI